MLRANFGRLGQAQDVCATTAGGGVVTAFPNWLGCEAGLYHPSAAYEGVASTPSPVAPSVPAGALTTTAQGATAGTVTQADIDAANQADWTATLKAYQDAATAQATATSEQQAKAEAGKTSIWTWVGLAAVAVVVVLVAKK